MKNNYTHWVVCVYSSLFLCMRGVAVQIKTRCCKLCSVKCCMPMAVPVTVFREYMNCMDELFVFQHGQTGFAPVLNVVFCFKQKSLYMIPRHLE